MLIFIDLLLFASTASAMLFGARAELNRGAKLPLKSYFTATRPLGFPNTYMTELCAVEPVKLPDAHQSFYKHTNAWKAALQPFYADYWKFDEYIQLDPAVSFNFSQSVENFTSLTNQLRKNPSADPRRLYKDSLYKGRQELLEKIPVELVFEWVDVLEEMNLRQRALILKKDEAIEDLTREKISMDQKSAQLEKTIVGLRDDKTGLQIALQQEKEANAVLLDAAAQNKTLASEVQGLEVSLAQARQNLEAEKQWTSKLDEEKTAAIAQLQSTKADLDRLIKDSAEEKENHIKAIDDLQGELDRLKADNAKLGDEVRVFKTKANEASAKLQHLFGYMQSIAENTQEALKETK